MSIRALMLIGIASALTQPGLGCSCVAMGVKYDLSASAVVFRGKVTEIKQLPLRKEMGDRRRYTATFSISEYWKGNPDKSLVLHVIEPQPDCIGARFNVGAEYVVFAVAQQARDYRLGNDFWYGWLDTLREGQEILTVNNFCDSTTEINAAKDTLKKLRHGRNVQ